MLGFVFAAVATWVPIDPQNALVIDSTKGRIVVALEPRLAPVAVERVKKLARMHVYDGLQMWRVLDTPAEAFIQTGDPGNHDVGRSSLPDIKSEFTAKVPVNALTFVRKGLDPEAFLGFVPVATQIVGPDDKTVRAWAAYCPGVVGMGRDALPDTENAEIFLMRGTTRWFDHDYTAIGRIVVGLDVARAANVGVPPKNPDVMKSVRVLGDVPKSRRAIISVLNVRSAAFAARVADTQRARQCVLDLRHSDVYARSIRAKRGTDV